MFAPWATPRLRACGVSVGLLLAITDLGAGRTEAAVTAVVAACAHDPALEASVARALKARVREIEPAPGARIEITFGCPVLPVLEGVTALMAHGHGGFVSLLDVDGRGAGRVARVRFQPAATPELSGPPPPIARATARPPDPAVHRALAFASAALASTIQIHPRIGAHAASTVTTSHDEALDIRLVGPHGQSSTRRWDGYVDSAHAAARVPLEVAWDALWAISDGPLRPAPPEDADRAAFRRLIDGDAGSRLETDALLQIGATLATRPAVGWLARHLDAPSERTRTLAVNALATATGTDLRHDASGAVRPLTEVVAAYRVLIRASSAPRH